MGVQKLNGEQRKIVLGYLKENYVKLGANHIAEKFNIDKEYVYHLARVNNVKTNKTTNKTCGELNDLQKQILISGIFGDGNYKKQGLGFMYRECHALGEANYCKWKYDVLGKLTEDNRFSYANRGNELVEFETMTTKDLEVYGKLNKDLGSAIELLDEIGLSLLILDDGWRSTKTIYPKNITFNLTTYQYTEEIRYKIIKQYEKYFGNSCCNSVGIKRVDLYFSKEASKKIAEIILSLLGSDMDIVQKKLFANKKEVTYEDIKHLIK